MPARPRPSGLTSYLRSQITAAVATGVDFATLVLSVELLSLWYVAGAGVGAFAGGATAFVLNRQWSFLAGEGAPRRQVIRYTLVWCGSLLLNVLLVYALTDGAGLPYRWSKVATAVMVGAAFNFPLHRHYVFR